jgi:hypothetical protein
MDFEEFASAMDKNGIFHRLSQADIAQTACMLETISLNNIQTCIIRFIKVNR